MSVLNVYRRRGSRREQSPLDTARSAFDLLVIEPFPLAIDSGVFGEDVSGEPVPLDQVRDRLLERDCSPAVRDAVWAHLVTRSRQRGGAWTVGCVGVALPGLTALAAELCAPFAGERAEIDAEVLAGFLAELATVDLTAPWISSRLRWAAYRAGLAAIRAALDRDIPVEDGFGSQPPPPPFRHPDFVLVRAVAEGVLTDAEADVIGVTRLEDLSLAAYAQARGIHPDACAAMRLRAEYRLVAYLLDPDTVADPPDEDRGWTDHIATTVALDHAARVARGTAPRRTRPRTVTAAERARSQHIRKSLPSNRPKSGVRGCGAKPSTALPAPRPPELPTEIPLETPEVPRCA